VRIPVTTKSRAFDELLLIAIDKAFSSLGESAKQSIYFHIETSNVTRNKLEPSSFESPNFFA
jgi:hypothetical protein